MKNHKKEKHGILFDLQSTQPNGAVKRHGGGRYGEVLLFKLIEKQTEIACFYDSSLWLNPTVVEACKAANIELFDVNSIPVEEIVKKTGARLLFSPLPEHLGNVSFESCRILGTQHGLRVIETPFDIVLRYHYTPVRKTYRLVKEMYWELTNKKRRQWHDYYKNRFLNLPIEYVTVSQHSKYSILSQFPFLREESIKVFYSPSTIVEQKEIKANKYGKYFLMVSGNRWEKNAIRGVQALDRLFCMGQLDDCNVVVTGITSHKDKKFQKICHIDYEIGRYHIKNKDRFIFLGYVPEEELNSLYANAYCFLYPTVNEGFGYPPLEAMHFGVPVLCSAISSLTEILADSVLYFAPHSVEEIMNRCVMISKPDIYREYCEKAKQRYAIISEKQAVALEELTDYIIAESQEIECNGCI